MSDFNDWDDIRAELHDGDDAALDVERARTEAWISAFHLAEERKRLGLTQRQVAELMGVTPGRSVRSRTAIWRPTRSRPESVRASTGARMRIIFDYGSDLRQIA